MRISDWSSDVCSSDLTGTQRDDAMALENPDAFPPGRPAHLELRQHLGLRAEAVAGPQVGIDDPVKQEPRALLRLSDRVIAHLFLHTNPPPLSPPYCPPCSLSAGASFPLPPSPQLSPAPPHP